MPDKAQDDADRQLKADDELLEKLRDHMLAHIDVYPFVLQTLNMALRAGIEANSCGGGEPKALTGLHTVIAAFVKADDPASAPFFEKTIYESPR